MPQFVLCNPIKSVILHDFSMGETALDIEEKKVGKKLYDYQKDAIDDIFDRISKFPEKFSLLYQLPTGGGKTVIFSEIAKRYIKETGKKVLILTHRIELCGQTRDVLTEFGVKTKIINSKVKQLHDQGRYSCFVAMVETLNNRLADDGWELRDLGMVIIDEAHYNSFRKLLKFFNKGIVLGVTATPLSSNIKLPMKENYDELIVGDSISALIEKGFLARATTYSYDVGLGSLKIGINGDYTVSSSEQVYTNYLMQEKLLYAYEEKSRGKKTLIFNSGIQTSQYVYGLFSEAGYEIKHLDSTNTEEERRSILAWFRQKPDAILTSVGILTTGFDEPTVETIILNRATRSLTLYHQMIGRGSRILPNKKEFTVIDLGNNALRFGLWENYINWYSIFQAPNLFLESLATDEAIEREFKYEMPNRIRELFANSKQIEFDMKEEYARVHELGLKSKTAIDRSIEQHAELCIENSEDIDQALELANLLAEDIEHRVKHYTYCICKSSESYLNWLQEDYKRKLRVKLSLAF